MLPVATVRGSTTRFAFATLRAWLRKRGIPVLVAAAWLGALAIFTWCSRPNASLVRGASPMVAVRKAYQIQCVEPEVEPRDTCEPDLAIPRKYGRGELGHTRITRRPCEWRPPPCGNAPPPQPPQRTCRLVY